MAGNVIRYTSRDYTTILQDINNDPILQDKPAWWKRAIAGIGDSLSMWLNAQGNNQFLETAFTREAVRKLVEMIDYQLTGVKTSSGKLIFHLDSGVSFPVSLSADDLSASTSGGIAASALRFEARSGVTVNETTETFTADDSTDELTVAREYATGEKVRFTTTGTLPSPLSASEDYYVIKVDSTTIKVASSIDDAFSGNEIDITSTGSGTHTIKLYSVQVTVYQQEGIEQYEAGEGDGQTEWREIDLRHSDILSDTVEVVISGDVWTQVDSFLDYDGNDKVYKFLTRTDGTGYLYFGNGTYGAICPDATVNVSYATGGGTDANISTLNSITVYSGGNADIEGVTNAESMNGGAEAESIDTARRIAPILLKARDRFVTTEDGEALAEEYGGLSQVQVIKNAYGVLSAKVIAIANGGGNPSSSLKSNLQTYLIERTLLEEMDIRVEDATITSYNVDCDVKVLDGYSWSDVQTYVELAWNMFFTDAGEELRKTYENDGIAAAVEFINDKWSYTFDETDYAVVKPLLDSYTEGTFAPRKFGVDVYSSDAFSFVAGLVTGVDYIQINNPSFPITLAQDEITDIGSITLSEVT